MTDARLLNGRRGCPLALVCVETVRREDVGMCTEMCGLLSAHLSGHKVTKHWPIRRERK
jgi:hypothetical protein